MDREPSPGRPPKPEDFRQTLPRKRTLEPGASLEGTPEAAGPESNKRTLEPGQSLLRAPMTPSPPLLVDDVSGPTMLGISPDAGKARTEKISVAETMVQDPGDARARVPSGYADEDDDLDGDARIGSVLRGYELQRRLGGGAMGVVYLGKHVEIGKQAAVKVLRASLSHRREVVERFLQEARAASRIDSPHVVDITDFGETDDGAPFFIMELLRGETLQARMNDRERMPWSELQGVLAQVLKALAAAHAEGIVHRDMKPENIMIAQSSRGELVKVLDFGIAKVIEESEADEKTFDKITMTGMIVGTAAYMSPEQAQSLPLDHRADIYSVGVIAYQAVTGRLPFDEDGFMAMVLAHATEEPTPPSAALRTGMFVTGGKSEIDTFVMRALAKDPDARFQSADAMREALLQVNPAAELAVNDGASNLLPKFVAVVAGALVLAMIAWLVFT